MAKQNRIGLPPGGSQLPVDDRSGGCFVEVDFLSFGVGCLGE
jgi:hypothetical protein